MLKPTQLKPGQKLAIINQQEYLYWNRYYWLPLKEIKHDCGRKLTIYKKFRLWKGELKEIRLGSRICPNCQVGY